MVVVALLGLIASPSSNSLTAQDADLPPPKVLGDGFDGGSRMVTLVRTDATSFFANGVLSNGQTLLALERDFMGQPDDLFATPQLDGNGNPVMNTFAITDEPLPPSEIPTSPGPEFTFDGGQAVFTDSLTQTTPSSNPLPADGQNGNYFVNYSFSQRTTVFIPAGGGGVAVRRIKLAENNNPLPQSRFYTTYNYFNDVPAGFGDVSRCTFGFEIADPSQRSSFEVRIPCAATLDSVQSVESSGARGFELGNIVGIAKLLVARTPWMAWSVGSGFAFPSADATRLRMGNSDILRVDNRSVHFLPFIATTWKPTERCFGHAFVQCDVDPFGNPVYADFPAFTGSFPVRRLLPEIGTLQDQTFLFVDASFGRWMCRNPAACVAGLAAVAELHYSSTLNDADSVSGNGIEISDPSRRTNILNLTLGSHVQFQKQVQLSSGFVIPLRRGTDKPFDFEYLLQFEQRF